MTIRVQTLPDDPTLREVIVEDVEDENFLAIAALDGLTLVVGIGRKQDVERPGAHEGSAAITVLLSDLLEALSYELRRITP